MKIDYDVDMDRFYIPVNSRYEIQTKGKGSSFRICNTKTHVINLVYDESLHEMLEDMARGTNAEISQLLAKIKDQQQHLAEKDLEIMRLRDALETAVEYQRSDVANFHSAYAGYYDEKHEQYDEDLKMVEQALSTPTTYDDLMAWHEAQIDKKFGKPVGQVNEGMGGIEWFYVPMPDDTLLYVLME